MTGKDIRSVPAARFRPGSAISSALSCRKGAGKAGRWLRPHRRVQWVVKNAHGFDRYSRDIPAFPAQWLYGLYVLSPGSGLSCPRCRRDSLRQRSARVAAPGPHDFAVRGDVFVRRKEARLTPQRPSQPAPRFVTTAKRPFWWARADWKIVLFRGIVNRYFGKMALVRIVRRQLFGIS